MVATADLIVIGAGIVGIATACELQSRQPGARIVLLEKEQSPALHQTGRNSGVIHAGVYYTPNSAKARFCREGKAEMLEFCRKENIPFERCGKLIVAVDEAECVRLADLQARAVQNGIEVEPVTGPEARILEPAIRAEAALWSPTTAIVDYSVVARRLAQRFTERGGEIRLGIRVDRAKEDTAGVRLTTSDGELQGAKAVVCAGLWADRLARAFGAETDFRIIPFRGEYYRIQNQPSDLVRRLIYPVPDPARPFLGVHLTRKLDGGFTVGPNAVLAAAREGYSGQFSLRDIGESLAYPGFWRLVVRNARSAVDELAGSVLRRAYLAKVQRYCPQIRLDDLVPYRPGIRAQAVRRDGRLVDDFLFVETRHSLHVCNAPSPAATAALPIARHIADRVLGPTAEARCA
ncbi:L-2-hydroxyglutarate oxidase [Rubellimicrobium rubrum]|uniref:L-2-hydroxyglutarate oxidase n=1 Tax=Rubellimicrobium rubrum TaxID=2585369 RepID=A0A5C4MXQ4_9RHOB|nr:L-2-hydroxyglutarate oxidase [Rubellimicrobium rubrum]TNC50408.1 L-2-hydroxyglutarate oxidase [Rubellimicrobium rubrum]